jgi:glycerophosphoryl diester phosphodiesterase
MLSPDRWGVPVAIAHRGSRYLWPENTMEAFAGAVEMGYRHLETDLHITSDGVLVCIHDHTVDRTTDGVGEVSSLTFDELRTLDAGFRHGTDEGFAFRANGVQVPPLEDLLTSFPDLSVVIDLKTDGMVEALAALINRLGVHERVIVGAFSDDRLAEFRQATNGTVATSTGPIATRMWVIASRLGRKAPGEASALQVPTQMRGVKVVDPKLVAAAHGGGLQVHTWTVNDPDEMERLLDIGVDGLITDRPDLLKQVLLARCQWGGR